MAIREGAWDCPSCGAKRQRGPNKHCTGCGAARDASVEFYLPEDAREVTDEAEQKKAEAGPDWTCPYCQGDNQSDSQFCGNCGANHESGIARKVTDIPDHKPEVVPTSGSWGKTLALGCGALFVVFLLLMWMASPSKAKLKVSAFGWDRVIQLESYQTVTEQAWEGEAPPGLLILSRHREIHHYNRIQDGYETRTRTKQVQNGTEKVKTGTRNMGNGYFKDIYEDKPVYKTVTETYQEPRYRQDPVYRYKLSYQVQKWLPSRDLKASANDTTAHWPDWSNTPNERERSRSETYRVVFSDAKGHDYTYTAPSESQWKTFSLGQACEVKYSGSQVTEILKP